MRPASPPVAPGLATSGLAVPTATPAAARAVADEFESVFLSQMLQTMTAGLGGEGPLGGGDNAFASLLQDEYAKLISRAGGIGIGETVSRQLIRLQEVGE